MVFKPKTNNKLKKAVDLWCNDKEKALDKYGEINTRYPVVITFHPFCLFYIL